MAARSDARKARECAPALMEYRLGQALAEVYGGDQSLEAAALLVKLEDAGLRVVWR
jgi:hypothetical protein